MHATELEAVVMGRVCVDLYPMQLRVPLEQVEGFHKYVGGFAGNVATGLARLGVRTAIVSAVGDDGHGAMLYFEVRRGTDTIPPGPWLGL
jgi:5-dehydro-2-deoxygluconokinase